MKADALEWSRGDLGLETLDTRVVDIGDITSADRGDRTLDVVPVHAVKRAVDRQPSTRDPCFQPDFIIPDIVGPKRRRISLTARATVGRDEQRRVGEAGRKPRATVA